MAGAKREGAYSRHMRSYCRCVRGAWGCVGTSLSLAYCVLPFVPPPDWKPRVALLCPWLGWTFCSDSTAGLLRKRQVLSFEAATARLGWASQISSTTQRTANAFGYYCFFALQLYPQFFFSQPHFRSRLPPFFSPSLPPIVVAVYCALDALAGHNVHRVSRADWPPAGFFPFLIHHMRLFSLLRKTVG